LPPELAPIWRRLAATLPGVTAADEYMLEQAAAAVYLAREALQGMVEGGMLVPARVGEHKRNPLFVAWRGATIEARAALSRLGGAPLDRQRLPDEPQPNPLFEVLHGVDQ
jgi:phage terminase small subunit